jgi:hypothetical protein
MSVERQRTNKLPKLHSQLLHNFADAFLLGYRLKFKAVFSQARNPCSWPHLISSTGSVGASPLKMPNSGEIWF